MTRRTTASSAVSVMDPPLVGEERTRRRRCRHGTARSRASRHESTGRTPRTSARARSPRWSRRSARTDVCADHYSGRADQSVGVLVRREPIRRTSFHADGRAARWRYRRMPDFNGVHVDALVGPRWELRRSLIESGKHRDAGHCRTARCHWGSPRRRAGSRDCAERSVRSLQRVRAGAAG